MMCDHCQELEERVRQLEQQLYGKRWECPVELGLTPMQARLLAALVANDRTLPRWFLFEASRGDGCWSEIEGDKLVHTVISKIRSQIEPFGLEILTVYNTGYRLTPESRARLLNWPSQQQAA